MKRKQRWFVIVLSVCVVMMSGFTAYSLDESDFDELEYHLLLQNIGMWDAASGLPANIVDLLDEMFVFDPKTKHYKVMYIDTPERALGQEHLILRVRDRVDKPTKSKITLKSRSAALADILALAECDKIKYEIDISGTALSYSVSSDITYHGVDDEALNVDVITPSSVFAYIQNTCPALSENLTSIEGNAEVRIPGIVDRYQFEGTLADEAHPLYDNVEFDFELWVFAPDQYLVELAFGGDSKDKEALDGLYEKLTSFFKDQGLLNQKQFSKTGFYFEFF